MNHSISSDDSFSATGSQLLSESLPCESDTGPTGQDLSISELSLSEQNVFNKPFSLLAKNVNATETSHIDSDPAVHSAGSSEDDTQSRGGSPDNKQALARDSSSKREEKLRSDMFILKKLNASFALFHDALESTKSANERIGSQLEQTDALLNKYIKLLSESEEFAKLIFDEEWEGVVADEEAIEQEYIEKIEKERREAEEKALAEQRERERREREELEKREQERRRLEQEKKERPAARGNRGVRGTRASMRASRGSATGSRTASQQPAYDARQLPREGGWALLQAQLQHQTEAFLEELKKLELPLTMLMEGKIYRTSALSHLRTSPRSYEPAHNV